MLHGIKIALNEFMPPKTVLNFYKTGSRVQHLVTFAFLGFAIGFTSISHAKTTSRAGGTSIKKNELSLEQKVENQIKLDLSRAGSFGINGLQAKGGDSSGGGNPEEVKFIATAIQIRNWLNLAPEFVKTNFGFEVAVFSKAIEETQISCAAEPYLSYIREKSKKAFFIQPLKTVFLDCDKFGLLTVDIEAFRGVIFHEYMRSAGIEGENVYQYSSRINWMISSTFEISISPVYGNYLALETRESAAVYYRGRMPVYRSASNYGNQTYIYDVELKKESDGVWVGEGHISEQFRMMPCYYPVRVRYQILYGYSKPFAFVQVALPAILPNYLDKDELTGKYSCPVPVIKMKTLKIEKID